MYLMTNDMKKKKFEGSYFSAYTVERCIPAGHFITLVRIILLIRKCCDFQIPVLVSKPCAFLDFFYLAISQ